jgi:hypothetical protein
LNNTFEDFSSSLKAKFCEVQSSSFLISLLISGILVNHKYLMIYNSDIDPHRKLLMLDYQGFSILIPISIALFYVYIYPHISKRFYSKSLEFNNQFKETKVEKLKKRILDEDDEKSLVKEIEKISNSLDAKTKFVSKMEREYTNKLDELKVSNKSQVDNLDIEIDELKISNKEKINILNADKKTQDIEHKAEINRIESTYKKEQSQLEKSVNTLNLEIKRFKLSDTQNKEQYEKLEYENKKNINNTINEKEDTASLLSIIKDYDKFQPLTTDKKVEKLLIANVAWNIIDAILGLEKGYTQSVRSELNIPMRNKTTDEIIIKEIHRIGEADTEHLLNRFKDLNEKELNIKINKLLQDGLINKIQNTESYYTTPKAKRVHNIK